MQNSALKKKKAETKSPYLSIFGQEFEKIIVIFEISSTPKFFKK